MLDKVATARISDAVIDMGWTFCERDKRTSTLDFFRRECEGGVLDAAAVGFGEVYIAYKHEDGNVSGVVCLTQWCRDFYNFGYKEIGEEMGPCDVRCPKRIMALLSEPEEMFTGDCLQWSKEWRQKVHEYWEGRKHLPKLQTGKTYEVLKPIDFSSGTLHVGDRIVCLNARRLIFHGPMFRCRLTRECGILNRIAPVEGINGS